jgi:hypothetical protein
MPTGLPREYICVMVLAIVGRRRKGKEENGNALEWKAEQGRVT